MTLLTPVMFQHEPLFHHDLCWIVSLPLKQPKSKPQDIVPKSLCHFQFYPSYSVDYQNMIRVTAGCEMGHNNDIEKCTFILFSDFCIFSRHFQRIEAKCPALPHSCTCTQDSIGPQGPPGPSVRTLSRHIPSSSFFLVYLHLLLMKKKIQKPYMF